MFFKKIKTFAILMLAMSFFGLIPAPASAGMVEVQKNLVNIRQRPTTSSTSLGMTNGGALFTVKSQENNWTEVVLDNGTGWIRSDLLQTAPQIRLTASSVRVRKGPGTNYDIIGQVNRGETYSLLEAQNGWYQIDRTQGQGWISGDYATVVTGGAPSAATVPAAAAIPTNAPVETPAAPAAIPTETPASPAASVPTEAPPISGGGNQNASVQPAPAVPVVQDVLAVPLSRGASFAVIDAGGRPALVIKGVDQSQVQTQVQSSSMGKSLSIIISGSYVCKYESALERLGLTKVSLNGSGGSLTVLIETNFSIVLKPNYNISTQSLELGLTDQIQTQSNAAVSASAPLNQGARRIVVIDPGHGGFTANGFDPGALGYVTRLPERVVVLDISTQLKAILENAGYTVIMTHAGSTTLSLTGRADVANNAGADIFVSVHANASLRHDYGGHSTYFYAPPSNPELYAQRRLRNMLAASIQGELVKAGGRLDLGVMESNFAVLRDTRVPSVLIETAFLSHPEEEQLLGSADYRRKLAEGIAEGIHLYFRSIR
jgi:N-acetylmuramoyl-L-alanine amidase